MPSRFGAVLAQYQKAPQVTRDRMYLETMQQIYASVTKVLVESRQGSSLLYLPLDRLLQQATTRRTPARRQPQRAGTAPARPR
jgi:membrane protease subunit HflK